MADAGTNLENELTLNFRLSVNFCQLLGQEMKISSKWREMHTRTPLQLAVNAATERVVCLLCMVRGC